MTLRLPALALAAVLAVPPALARAGDPAVGEAEFRQCRSCHMVVSPAGETFQRGGRVGPNLFGVAGRRAGTADGFRYSPALVAAGQAGLVWTEEAFVAYVADPTGFMRRHTGDSSIRSPMNFQSQTGVADIFAYLQSLQG
jgi:cytochrome c